MKRAARASCAIAGACEPCESQAFEWIWRSREDVGLPTSRGVASPRVAPQCVAFTSEHAAALHGSPRPSAAPLAPLPARPTAAKRTSVVLASAKTDAIIEEMKTLTLLEASELVAQIEEVFGVDASAPAGGMMMAAGPAAGGEAAEEKTEFDLVIDNVDADKRIAIIKVVRGLTDLGLKEAKDAVTNVPFTILAGKTKGEVEEAKKALEEGGAKCSIK